MKVAIVGAGYAGMAAAVSLADHSIPVTVFEAAALPGGRARRVEVQGVTLDNGLHLLIGAYRETLRLIERVNPEAERVLARVPLDWIVHRRFRLRAARLPAPLHLIVGMLRADGLSLSDRLGALRFVTANRIHRFEIPGDMTVEALLDAHRQSARLRAVLWYPLCVAALNTPPQRASARVFLRALGDTLGAGRHDSDFILPRTDLTALFPEPAVSYVESRGGRVRTRCRVTAIDPATDGFSIAAGGREDSYTHVICALAPHQAKAFLVGMTALADIAETIERFDSQPIYSVYLRYPRSIGLPAPMLGLDSEFVHWVFDRELLCGQAGVVGAVISAEGRHQQLTHDELARAVHDEIGRQLGPLPAPLWSQVIAEKRATFACTPALARPAQRTPLRNFFLAGDYTVSDYPATLEAAVRSGIAAANMICEARDGARRAL